MATVQHTLDESLRQIEDLKACIEKLRSIDRAGFPEVAAGHAHTAEIVASKIRGNMSSLVGVFSGQVFQRGRRCVGKESA